VNAAGVSDRRRFHLRVFHGISRLRAVRASAVLAAARGARSSGRDVAAAPLLEGFEQTFPDLFACRDMRRTEQRGGFENGVAAERIDGANYRTYGVCAFVFRFSG